MRILEIHFAQSLKRARGDFRRIRHDSVSDFETELIGLVLEVAADGVIDRREEKAEDGKK